MIRTLRALRRPQLAAAIFFLLPVLTLTPGNLHAQTATTTLSVSPASAAAGSVFTLSANVTSGGAPVTAGLVVFQDTYPSVGGVTETLATVELQGGLTGATGTPGLATVKRQLGGLGTHTITATFQTTSTVGEGTPATQTVTLGPGERASATGSAGTYALTGTIFSFDPSIIPNGTFTFTDITSGAILASAVGLDRSTLIPPTPTDLYPHGSVFDPISPASSDLRVGNSAAAPALGDFNGDGFLDMVVPSNDTFDDSQSGQVWLGNGDGTFTPGATLSSRNPSAAVVGDFNGDGKLDIALLNTLDINSVDIYLGNGDGTFKAPVPYATAAFISSDYRTIAIGDLNNDGYQDLVIADRGTNSQAIVLLGKGDGTFQSPVDYPTPTNAALPFNVAIGDVDGDGNPDLVLGSDHNPAVTIMLGIGDGTFAKPGTVLSVPSAAGANGQGGSVALADLRGDGNLDLIVSDQPGKAIYVFLNSGSSGTFLPPTTYPIAGAPYFVTTGDFNHDGFVDLLVVNNGGLGDQILLNKADGTGTFFAPVSYANGSTPVASANFYAVVGDINGDGLDDIVTSVAGSASSTSPQGFSLLLSNLGISTDATPVTITGCGTQTVTATYSGDSTYPPGTSAGIPLSPAATTTTPTTLTLTATPTSIQSGQPITLTATLTPSTGSDGETITFTSGSTPLGTATLKAGVATLTLTTTLPVGTDNIVASYTSDCILSSSTGTTTVTVTPASPSGDFIFQLTGPSSVSGVYGSSGQFTFLVSPLAGATAFPGTVQFSAGGGPVDSTFTFSPTSVAATGGTTTITLTAVTRTLAQRERPALFGHPLSGWLGGLAPISLALFLLPLRLARRLRRSGSHLAQLTGMSMIVLLLAGSLAGFVSLTGCGSGYFAHDYPIVVTATSAGISHTIIVDYDIQKSSQ